MNDEQTRVELDLRAVITNYAHVEILNGRNLEQLLGNLFDTGSVVTIHIVIEETGLRREQCKWIDESSQYKHVCDHVMDANGVCPLQPQHDAKDRDLLQPKLEGVA